MEGQKESPSQPAAATDHPSPLSSANHRPFAMTTRQKKTAVAGVVSLLFLGVLYYSDWINSGVFEDVLDSWGSGGSSTAAPLSQKTGGRYLPRSPFACPIAVKNLSCHSPSDKSPPRGFKPSPPPSSCPDYFRWIHEDLRPWRKTGITRRMVERAGRTANFRLLVVNGRLYVESYSRAFQTRDTFNWWGFVQLLSKYPGQIPDLDLMFDCDDIPVIHAARFSPRNRSGESPPPLFGYCKDDNTLNIPFPDWSFWGWSELNIKPWVGLAKELKEANERTRWEERQPYAFWKGNPYVSPERVDLLSCNLSLEHDWNARLFTQDWIGEINSGFQHSNLADQCTYRYKIYVEGQSWSVSKKYILACDSLALLLTPRFHDFFSRGLVPLKHYWPIRTETKCRSIKFAVDRGNANQTRAADIRRNASRFMREDLKMDNVYDYMFHLLNEYARLLRYRPRVPRNAVEVCSDSLICTAQGRDKTFMMDSRWGSNRNVSSRVSVPCSLPPAFTAEEIELISRKKDEAVKLVQTWEQQS